MNYWNKERALILKMLLVVTGVFNVVDYFFTLYAMENGFVEFNPLVKPIISTRYFTLVKLIIIPFLLSLVWWSRAYIGKRIFFYAGTVFAAYFTLMVYFKYILWSGHF